MAKLYTGIINLSRIPKELIKEKANGEKFIYVDFAERKTPSAYGHTHYIKIFDLATRTNTYIGDFKEKDLGGNTVPASESLEPQPDDLPY